MTVDGLPSTHDRELDLLRSNFRRRVVAVGLKVTAAIVAVLMIAVLVAILISDTGSEHLNYPRVVSDLRQNSAPWSQEMFAEVSAYHTWLTQHGTQGELSLFERFAVKVGTASLSSSDSSATDLSWFSSICLSLYSGTLRVLFIVIASCRLWLAVAVCCLAYGLTTFEAYKGTDVLGQTGNGRVFYSGIRAGLDKLSASGAPDVLLRGLACPQRATSAEAKASPLWRVLSKYGATNQTNEALTAVLVKNSAVASYVALLGEEAALDACYAGSTVAEHAPHLVEAALSLHASYAHNERIENDSTNTRPARAAAGKLTSQQYALLVCEAFHRVLTPEMRRCIGKLTVNEVATLVLALEAGKVLAYTEDGGRWTRRSNFVHLNARAVLHSLLEFPADYTFESRATLRRAMIYASRRSAFAPVRMPLDMSKEEWALRQWSEVLLSLPHELDTAAEEIELAGLIREGHEAWNHEFFDRSVLVSPALTSVSYVTPYGLLLVPFTQLLDVVKHTLPISQQHRLHELATLVSQRQAQQMAKAEASEGGLPTFDRVLPPLTDSEIASLAELHGLEPDALRAWSALRLILNGYSWLGRRVGDYTVPDSSIIFAVFKCETSTPEVNALGLLGKTGMVPLRGGKLLDRLGPSWSARFIAVNGATMAETQEDFEKLMRGIKDRDTAPEVAVEPLTGA